MLYTDWFYESQRLFTTLTTSHLHLHLNRILSHDHKATQATHIGRSSTDYYPDGVKIDERYGKYY
jgi:hypothetical protein